jgi:hypothetical protein
MTAQELLAVWEGGVLVIFLFIAWIHLRADYGVDKFRQEMFAMRDEMFDYAGCGQISFNHPAYTQLRNLANGLIRFAHRMTFWRILMIFALCSFFGVRRTLTFDADLERDIASIGSIAVQEAMRGFHKKIGFLIARQLIRSSVVFWPLVGFVLGKYLLRAARAKTWAMRETAESPAVQRTIPTIWIEEQAIASV